MKICRNCHKHWCSDKDCHTPDCDCFWKHFKTAELTWCGVCIHRMSVEFDLQLEPKKRVLRLEAKK